MAFSLWLLVGLFAICRPSIFPVVDASAIFGKFVCNRCWDRWDSGMDDPIRWNKVTVNCSVKCDNKSTFVVATGLTGDDGNFMMNIDSGTNSVFLNTLYVNGNPTKGFLPGGPVLNCVVKTSYPDCDTPTFHNGECNGDREWGNSQTSNVDLVNIKSGSVDMRINGRICNSPSSKYTMCPVKRSPPPPKRRPPPPKRSPPPQKRSPPPPKRSPPPPKSSPPPTKASPPPSSSPPATDFPPPTSFPPPPTSSPPPATSSSPPPATSPPPQTNPPTNSPPPPTSVPPPTTDSPPSPPPSTPPGGEGDPHFIGADGSHFDFQGEPNTTFCLISDTHIHINAYYGGRYESQGNKPLTWIRKVGILWGQNTIVLAAREGPEWHYDNGYLASIEVNGEPFKLGQVGDFVSFADGSIQIQWIGAKVRSGKGFIDVYQVVIASVLKLRVMIRPEMALLRTKTDGVIHVDFELPLLDVSDNVHGVLGQTYRTDHRNRLSKQKLTWSGRAKSYIVVGENAEGFLDGKVSDYMSSGLLQPDCRYSRFVQAHIRDEELAQATELTTPRVKNTNDVENIKTDE